MLLSSTIDWLEETAWPMGTNAIATGMNKQRISIKVGDELVKGILLLNDDIWAFGSDDIAFQNIYPTGMTYSFSKAMSEDERAVKAALSEVFSKLQAETA